MMRGRGFEGERGTWDWDWDWDRRTRRGFFFLYDARFEKWVIFLSFFFLFFFFPSPDSDRFVIYSVYCRNNIKAPFVFGIVLLSSPLFCCELQ